MTRELLYLLWAAVGSTFICLLVCIGLLAFQPASTGSGAIDVVTQDYRREMSDMRRDYELKIGRLTEQMVSNDYTSRKRLDLLEDEQKRLKRELDDLRARMQVAPKR